MGYSDKAEAKYLELKDKLTSLGYPTTGRILGFGSFGVAIEMPGNKVMKITADKTEAKAASLIVGKKLKNVYRVYEVFTLKSLRGTFFFIICEHLQKVSFVDETVDLLTTGNYKKIIETEYGGNVKNAPPDVQQIINGLKELDDIGIDFHDVHLGNIMKRGNQLVLIDLGMSKSPQGQINLYEHFQYLLGISRNATPEEDEAFEKYFSTFQVDKGLNGLKECINNQQDLKPEYNKIVNKHFWDLF